MVSRQFWAWTGAGLLAVALIPTLAAPHLAKLIARKPAPTAPAKPAKPVLAKKATTRPTVAATTKPAPVLAQAQPVKKAVAIKRAPKPTAVKAAARIERQPKPKSKKPNPQLTARTLLH